MSKWKDEDIATPELAEEYLKEFQEGMENNPHYSLEESEKTNVQASLKATHKFCLGLLSGNKQIYMHDLILMAIGFYGGYLTAKDEIEQSN